MRCVPCSQPPGREAACRRCDDSSPSGRGFQREPVHQSTCAAQTEAHASLWTIAALENRLAFNQSRPFIAYSDDKERSFGIELYEKLDPSIAAVLYLVRAKLRASNHWRGPAPPRLPSRLRPLLVRGLNRRPAKGSSGLLQTALPNCHHTRSPRGLASAASRAGVAGIWGATWLARTRLGRTRKDPGH